MAPCFLNRKKKAFSVFYRYYLQYFLCVVLCICRYDDPLALFLPELFEYGYPPFCHSTKEDSDYGSGNLYSWLTTYFHRHRERIYVEHTSEFTFVITSKGQAPQLFSTTFLSNTATNVTTASDVDYLKVRTFPLRYAHLSLSGYST